MPRSQRIQPTKSATQAAREAKAKQEAQLKARREQVAREVREGDRKPLIPTGRRNPNQAEAERAMINNKNRNAAAKAKATGKAQRGF